LKKRLRKLTAEALRAATAAWFRERIDLGPALALMAKKTVPIHRHSWIYLLGGAALFLLGLQVAGGALLMLYYQPTEAAAYESVQRIMTEVPCGWLVRGVHIWGGHLFIAVACLHFLSVLFTAAYRRPREITWVSGVLLMFFALGSGFSGYLLPWNELSYYATLVGTQIPGTVPFAGEWIVHFLRGGPQVTGDTITRFYAAHVMIVPLTFALVLAVHLIQIQAQGMSLPLGMSEKRVRDNRPFFTEFVLIDACVWLLHLGSVITLAVFLPAELGVKADPLRPAPEGIKPEWYFLFMFETLKHLPERLGVALFALAAVFFLVLPFLDRSAAREKRSAGLTVFVLVLLVCAVVFEMLALFAPGVKHVSRGSDKEQGRILGTEAAAPPATAGLETPDPLEPRPLAEDRPPQPAGPTVSLSGSIVWLVMFWSVIGFLIIYLRKLLLENTRIRKLYRPGL